MLPTDAQQIMPTTSGAELDQRMPVNRDQRSRYSTCRQMRLTDPTVVTMSIASSFRLRWHHPGYSTTTHLTWLATRYPSAEIQEKLAYLQKREMHMQYPTYQQAGWPIGSGSVESANKVVVEARLKGAGMRWGRQNVNRMLVLRNAVCNRQWHETRATSLAQRQALRTSQRQADSQQRLTSAWWFLVFCAVRVYRLSHPPVPVATSPTAQVLAAHPVRRPGAGYSWHKPFLRRPPSTPTVPGEISAKK